MIKNMLVRQLEVSGEWILCKSKHCDRFLLESSLYEYPIKGMQNLLKLEIGVREASLGANLINYEMHLTIRLVKVTYVD